MTGIDVQPRTNSNEEHDSLVDLIARRAIKEGTTETAIPELTLVRVSQPLACTPAMYSPSLCVVGQGQKRAHLAGHTVVYDRLNYLVCSMPLPIETEIVRASPSEPFLGLVLRIDPIAVSQILVDMDEFVEGRGSDAVPRAIMTSRLSCALEQAMKRLLAVADDSVARRVLGSGLLREIYYEALCGSQGHALRATVLSDSHAYRVARVVRYIEQHCEQSLDIETIAREAGMSSSGLHHHFKQVTTMSPIQYIKKLRLHRAKAKLLAGKSAAEAAFEVGYASPSQFSREFRRFFGFAPSEVRQKVGEVLGSRTPAR